MRLRPLLATALALVAVALAACGGDGVESDAERFCGEAIANTEAIVDPPLEDEAGVEATLAFYRVMGELAPLSIAEEWNVLLAALETANELEPGDADAEQLVAATAYASERAAYDVKVWLERNCGLEIPITTIAPQEGIPAATTTRPSTTTATSGD